MSMDVGKFISYLKSNELKRVEGGIATVCITLILHWLYMSRNVREWLGLLGRGFKGGFWRLYVWSLDRFRPYFWSPDRHGLYFYSEITAQFDLGS